MPTRRASATVLLVALTLGAGVAGSAMMTAPPRVTGGTALASAFLVEHAVPPAARLARTVPPDGASLASAPAPTTTTETTTTEASTTEPPPTTPTAPPTSTATRTSSPAVSPQQRVVDLVNAERAKAGCRPLTVDQRLVAAAQAHTTDMAVNNYFSHTSLDGRTFSDRILAAGYPHPGAENIAKGYRTADEVMRAWMRSQGHRANILDCSLVAIGVGFDTRGWYWTQDFGR